MSGQGAWGWKVAAYLFVSGTGAGAYAVGAAAQHLVGAGRAATLALALGPLLVGPATLLLVWDLGRPAGFLRAARRPGSSWISRGVGILSGFLVVSAVHVLLAVGRSAGLAVPAPGILAIAGAVLALLTMVYTGLLLGAVRPIPFWSTPVLPVLFLVSSLSTGVMAVDLVLSIAGTVTGGPGTEALATLRTTDLFLLALEALVITLYVSQAHATAAARASTALVTTGALASRFWGGVVVAGIGVPFVVQLVEVMWPAPVAPGLAMLSSGSGLLGGLLLRHVVVAGGVKSPLNAAGLLFAAPGQAGLRQG